MEPVYGVAEIRERYRCTERTARKYMTEMGTLGTRPMLVTESAVMRWEAARQARADRLNETWEAQRDMVRKMERIRPVAPKPGQYISRVRPKAKA